jgi:cytochrome c-type biogenesis protein CcmH/NrfF
MVATSLASGALFTIQGWQAMNMWAVPVLLLAGAAVLWLASVRRHRNRTA